MRREEAYSVLGVDPDDASEVDIRKAYRKLALQWHPDKCDGSEEATNMFQRVNTAYRILTDEEEADDDSDMFDYEYDDMDDFSAFMFAHMFRRHGGGHPGEFFNFFPGGGGPFFYGGRRDGRCGGRKQNPNAGIGNMMKRRIRG